MVPDVRTREYPGPFFRRIQVLFRICLSLALLFLPVVAQQDAPYQHLKDGDYGPSYLTTTPTDILTRTVFVTELDLTNESASTVTVDVLDKQGSPVPLLKGVSIAAKTAYVVKYEGRRATGGLTVSASANSAVNIWVRFKW